MSVIGEGGAMGSFVLSIDPSDSKKAQVKPTFSQGDLISVIWGGVAWGFFVLILDSSEGKKT